jgi:hypothetical protein
MHPQRAAAVFPDARNVLDRYTTGNCAPVQPPRPPPSPQPQPQPQPCAITSIYSGRTALPDAPLSAERVSIERLNHDVSVVVANTVPLALFAVHKTETVATHVGIMTRQNELDEKIQALDQLMRAQTASALMYQMQAAEQGQRLVDQMTRITSLEARVAALEATNTAHEAHLMRLRGVDSNSAWIADTSTSTHYRELLLAGEFESPPTPNEESIEPELSGRYSPTANCGPSGSYSPSQSMDDTDADEGWKPPTTIGCV